MKYQTDIKHASEYEIHLLSTTVPDYWKETTQQAFHDVESKVTLQ
jgi:hypothetical protein